LFRKLKPRQAAGVFVFPFGLGFQGEGR